MKAESILLIKLDGLPGVTIEIQSILDEHKQKQENPFDLSDKLYATVEQEEVDVLNPDASSRDFKQMSPKDLNESRKSLGIMGSEWRDSSASLIYSRKLIVVESKDNNLPGVPSLQLISQLIPLFID